jgi:acyl dehydratase
MAITVLKGLDGIRAALGNHLGYTDWVEIDQQRVNLFAIATGDHQWIHVDLERAAAGPYGSAIAHGYLTLSLSNYFLPQIVEVLDVSMGVNYGLDRVRFPQPVRVGSRVRAGALLRSVEDIAGGGAGGVQTTIVITIELADNPKPACVIDSLSRWYE